MKTLYIFRNSFESKYILSELEKKNLVDVIIIESGKTARAAKLRNLFKNASLLIYPKIILDTLAILVYSYLTTQKVAKKLGDYNYPEKKVQLLIDDANEQSCIKFIKKNQPDIIFIYGTAILKEKFLTKVKTKIINIHSGILPMYRNVHSDFWSFLNKDYGNIGTSLIHLDKGIDSGDIFFQRAINFEKKDGLIDVKIKTLQLIPNLVDKVIKYLKTKKIIRIRQNKSKTGFYKTPGFMDLIKLPV